MKRETPRALLHLEGRLLELRKASLYRARPEPAREVARTFCSNDYLGLASADSGTSGAGASRLIVGERPEHRDLEHALAEWLDLPKALLFSSGYAANVGVLSALVAKDDVVISDALNHASIVDGCRLARGRVEVVPHLDLSAVARILALPRTGRAWVVSESYFSMDADGPDLVRLREICDAGGAALVLDEAHALGVFGPRGTGRSAAVGVTPDVLIGALGKAFGASGAFVAGSTVLVDWLWNRARSFVFSTGMSPLVASAALRALEVVRADSARDRLHANVAKLRRGLLALGLAPLGEGPIIPVVIGDSARAIRAASELQHAGVYVQAVRPPTVPEGSARLRITATALHTDRDIECALRAIEERISWLHLSC